MIVGIAAALGLGAIGTMPSPSPGIASTDTTGPQFRTAPANNARPISAAPSERTIQRSISAAFGLGDTGRIFGGTSGMSPKEWGMSAECAKMVRKNRLTRLGVGAARI